ncbi:MAG: YggS family pyridoxal phosphate-dependent enzyme [Flavobacteriia bacterium]|nr:YggS family pyridoxal phosphate-dependent enzyme [Flavobacteriia bacterium]
MIHNNLTNIRSKMGENVTLVAVSKTKPMSMLQEAYDAGQRVFGENKVQEMVEKYEQMPKDIKWHMIGHLQSNKVKYIAPFVDLIHGVDSLKLLEEINKQAKKNHRIISCLLQFHIAQEETKFGLSLEEAESLLSGEAFPALQNIQIAGVMGMATFTEDTEQVRKEFKSLKSHFEVLKSKYFPLQNTFTEISMGMSDDYQIAMEEGSTLIRVGSKIFGSR